MSNDRTFFWRIFIGILVLIAIKLAHANGFQRGLASQPPDAERNYFLGYTDAVKECENVYGPMPSHGLTPPQP